MKVASRMSRNIISIEPDVLINQAAALMIENSINRLPVVDPATRSAQNQGGMVLGIITRLDIMRCLAAVWL
jgi:CBS domain-containing protein